MDELALQMFYEEGNTFNKFVRPQRKGSENSIRHLYFLLLSISCFLGFKNLVDLLHGCSLTLFQWTYQFQVCKKSTGETAQRKLVYRKNYLISHCSQLCIEASAKYSNINHVFMAAPFHQMKIFDTLCTMMHAAQHASWNNTKQCLCVCVSLMHGVPEYKPAVKEPDLKLHHPRV